jgi:pilus assembly protein CpaE
MKAMKSKSKAMEVILVTVSVDTHLAAQLTDSIQKMPWSVSASSFDAYISATRRPSLGVETKSAEACIAIVDFDKDPEQAAETALYLAQIFAGKLTVVALAKHDDPSLLLTAMRAGCSEFIYKPLEDAAIARMLDRLAQLWTSTAAAQQSPTGTVISLLGAKGGVGTTTLAMHLAVYLAQFHGKRTLLIDNRPELGHVCVYLGIDGSRYQFHELVRNVNRLDSELLHGFVARHASGLDVLASPDVHGGMMDMSADAVSRTLEFLRGEYDYVILDCAPALDAVNLAVVNASAIIYLVTTPEIGAIRDLSRCIDRLSGRDQAPDALHVVLNRQTPSQTIRAEQIEKAIKLPIAIAIPDTYAELARSTNLGQPLLPKSKLEFSMQLAKWAETLVGAPRHVTGDAKEKRLFSLWSKTALHSNG